MASTSLPIIKQSASVFNQVTPSTSDLDALAANVDSGVYSLSQVILAFAYSSQRTSGNTDTLARLFFILFNRPPDLLTYQNCIALMNSGTYSMKDICFLGLQLSTSVLSNSNSLNNKDFVYRVAGQMFQDPASIIGLKTVLDSLVAQLDTGLTTRSDVLLLAAKYDAPNVIYHNWIEPSLDYLAVTSRPPSQTEILAAMNVPELSLLRQLFASNGSSAYGSYPFLSINANKLSIYGNFSGTLNLDLGSSMSDLSGVTSFRVYFSQDDGLTESSSFYKNSLLGNITNVDATGLTGQVKGFSFNTGSTSMTVTGPNLPSTLKSTSGNSTLIGGSASTIFYGGTGYDNLIGGSGNDTLYAGINSVMQGGAGNDTFTFPSVTSLVTTKSNIVIKDFGNGADVINLAKVTGNQATPQAPTPIVGSSTRGTGFVNTAAAADNVVFLVYNTGQWVDEASNVNFGFRTKQQIANLFTTPSPISGITNPVTFTKAPTVGQTYFVFVYDPPANNGASAFSGVEIWMINNLAPLAMVDSSECTLIGQMTNYGNLWSAINSTGSIAL